MFQTLYNCVASSLEAAKDARLRRICEIKPSGRCHVPPAVHEEWKRGGASKDQLMERLAQCDFKKARLQKVRSLHACLQACICNM